MENAKKSLLSGIVSDNVDELKDLLKPFKILITVDMPTNYYGYTIDFSKCINEKKLKKVHCYRYKERKDAVKGLLQKLKQIVEKWN